MPAGHVSGAVTLQNGVQLPIASDLPREGPLRIVRPPTGRGQVEVTRDGKLVPGVAAWLSTWNGAGTAPADADDFGTDAIRLQVPRLESGETTLEVVAGAVSIQGGAGRFLPDLATPHRVTLLPGASLEVELVLK